MEQSTFFREATLAICGHLDIERSLFAAFQVLQQWMPLDRIYAQLYEPGMNCMHFIAKASQRGGESQNFPLPLPEEAKRMAQSMRACTDDVSLYIFDKLNIPISSILGLPIIIEGEPFGAYFLTAEGTGRYTRRHARMLAALREPFYIALSNAIRHRSIMQLKNLLPGRSPRNGDGLSGPTKERSFWMKSANCRPRPRFDYCAYCRTK
jgi:hypothetical protein